MVAIGNPVPMYIWVHNGEKVASTDKGLTSTVTISSMQVSDFGNYTLTMYNSLGVVQYDYSVAAEGIALLILLSALCMLTNY